MKPILLRLDEALVDKIDRMRGDVPRTVWITRACENKANGTLDPRDYALGDFARQDTPLQAEAARRYGLSPGRPADPTVAPHNERQGTIQQGVRPEFVAKRTVSKPVVVEPHSTVTFGPVASTPGSRLKK